MSATHNDKIPVILKSYEGKPDIRGVGLGFSGNERVEWVSLKRLVIHVYEQGRLFLNGDYDLARWKAEGAQKTARQRKYFQSSNLFVADIDEGLPAGTPREVIEYLLASSTVVRDCAGAIFPSSSYRAAKPKMHLLFRLDSLLSDYAEFCELHARLRAALPFKSDPATGKPVQPLFGTAHVLKDGETALDFDETVIWENYDARLSVEWLRSLSPTKQPAKERAKQRRIEKRGAMLHNVARTSRRGYERASQLAMFVLDNCGGKMPNDNWYAFRRAAQAASNNDVRVFDDIATSAYWKRYADEYGWDVEAERLRWESEPPLPKDDGGITVGTLYRMALDLGYGTVNAAEITPTARSTVSTSYP